MAWDDEDLGEDLEAFVVRDWRLQCLLDLGFDVEQATALYDVADVRAQAERLIANGCPPAVAARILLPVAA